MTLTPEQGVRIRRARASDAAAVADTWLRSRQASFPAIPASPHTDDEGRAFVADVMIPANETWIAVNDTGDVLGVLALHDGWINHLYVAPESTGCGIGTQLLEIAKSGYADLQLWAFESNTGARRFYERHGFIDVEHTDGSTNEERAPDVRYRWPP
jgi:ribosomal protein S18 acetylase RimI-like enzyme